MIKKKIGAILKKFVRNSEWYTKQFLDCEKFWNLEQFGNEVAFIGSDSGHYACNALNNDKKCVDFTLRDSTLLQNYEVLRNYSSFLKEKDCTVFMVITPFDFLTGSTTYFEDRYYTILNMASIPGFAYEKRAEVMSRKNNPILYYPFFCLKKDLFAKHPSKYINKITAEQYVDHIKQRYSIRDFGLKLSMINQDSLNDSVLILDKINEFCKEHGFNFYLVFPPVTEVFAEYLSQFTSNESYINMLSKLKDIDIKIQDYSYDKSYIEKTEYFISELYLNETGSKEFTNQLLT